MARDLDLAGEPLIDEYIRRYGETTLQSFSRGKDSIACALGIRHRLNIVPMFFVAVPGLEFVDESLDYYERTLFHRHILRLPHPSFYRHLNNGLFQTASTNAVIEAANLKEITHLDVFAMAMKQEGLKKGSVLTAIGARAADSALRRMSMKRHGPFRPSTLSWWPIHDYNKERLVREIERAKISLPVDYLMFGRSFDGLDAQYLIPIKKQYPRDYRRILDWYPLIEAEVWLYEKNQQNAAAPQARAKGQRSHRANEVAQATLDSVDAAARQ